MQSSWSITHTCSITLNCFTSGRRTSRLSDKDMVQVTDVPEQRWQDSQQQDFPDTVKRETTFLNRDAEPVSPHSSLSP